MGNRESDGKTQKRAEEKRSVTAAWLICDMAGILLLTAADLVTKEAASRHLPGNPVILIRGVLELCYLENRGAAFGILPGRAILLSAAACIFLAAGFWILFHLPVGKYMRPLRIVTVMICAGAAGNLYDRIRLGYVRDFISFILIRFPIFNLADIFVTCGAGAACILLFTRYRDEELLFSGERKEHKGRI